MAWLSPADASSGRSDRVGLARTGKRVDLTPAIVGTMRARLRWIMWGIPAFIFVFAFVHRVAPGVVAKEIMQAFEASGTIVGLLSAMYFYAYAGFMIPAGLLIDGLGVRRVVSAGAAVMGLGSLAMGLAATPSVLFGGRFLVGLGATVTFIGCLKIAASWFPPSHFGTMSAISATMGMLGALLGTAPLAALVAAAGWRGAFVTIGAIPLLGALLCFVFVRDHPRGHVEESAPVPGLASVVRGMLEVLGNRHTWPPFLAFFFLYSAMGNLMLWGVPFLRDVYALSNTRAAAFASAVTIALLLSAPLTATSRIASSSSASCPTPCSRAVSFSPGQSSCSRSARCPSGAWPFSSSPWASPAAASC